MRDAVICAGWPLRDGAGFEGNPNGSASIHLYAVPTLVLCAVKRLIRALQQGAAFLTCTEGRDAS
jgi:hypothetical protein